MFFYRPWTDEAKCVVENMDPNLFDLEARGDNKLRGGVAKQAEAQRLCAGCPVMAQCALDAMKRADMGVVRGGVAITYAAVKKDVVARLMFVAEYGRPGNLQELREFARTHDIPTWSMYGLDYRSNAA